MCGGVRVATLSTTNKKLKKHFFGLQMYYIFLRNKKKLKRGVYALRDTTLFDTFILTTRRNLNFYT